MFYYVYSFIPILGSKQASHLVEEKVGILFLCLLFHSQFHLTNSPFYLKPTANQMFREALAQIDSNKGKESKVLSYSFKESSDLLNKVWIALDNSCSVENSILMSIHMTKSYRFPVLYCR